MGANHQINQELIQSSTQYRRLSRMHKQLEHEIHEVSGFVSPDDAVLRALKTKKLRIADQMSIMERTG